jgi:hypothetical protein
VLLLQQHIELNLSACKVLLIIMSSIPIHSWADVNTTKWDAVLLGNGASVAIHTGFSYQTLHGVAAEKELLPTTVSIFEKLGTTDFEHVLLACWYAELVNKALETPSPHISEAYKEVRKALIETVHNVHPVHANVESDLQRAGKFASAFSTVISLNYDLTLYWAMLLFNQTKGKWFKDAFLNGKFQTDWKQKHFRTPSGNAKGASLVFYPHGNLCIARDHMGDETKITTNPEDDLLKTITDRWSSGNQVPVFVSEGTSEQKVAAIRRSRYLTHVYEQILPGLGENIVVYGWSFDERDQHVLDAISKKPPKQKPPERMAVSVFTGLPDEDQQAFCYKVLTKIKQSLPNTHVDFFDSQSPGCWNNL